MKFFIPVLAALCCLTVTAQDSTGYKIKGVYFPYPIKKPTQFSIGFTNTTMPYDITEELHFRVPAIDLRVIKRVSDKFVLDLHGSFQVFQNLVSIGPRYTKVLGERYSVALGDDMGFWYGIVNAAGLRTTGRGFQNTPNFSIGRRFKRRVLLTFRAEAQMNFGIKTYAKSTELVTEHRFLSGSSYALILEQPFYGNKVLSLGFRAIYTDFFWQTWALFETFDRNIFYPQVIVGLNL